MTHYDHGRRFEYRVRDALTADGYTVLRTAGSKSPVDLIAFKPPAVRDGHLLFVQCKRTSGTIRPAERDALRALAVSARAVPIVAHQPLPRRPITYRQLTGPGPKDWQPWTPDEVAG